MLIKQQKIILATICDYKCDYISEYITSNIKERNISEDLHSYNSKRVQDGGYMDKIQN